jgi:lipopolysaccharide export system protein LptC
MKPRLQLILTSLILSVFVMGSYAYMKWDQWFAPKHSVQNSYEQPDMVAISVEQLNFDRNGQKQYLLGAESMLQYLKSNRNVMVRPTITFYKETRESWKTSASSAVSDNEGDQLHLSGDVTIVQQGVKEAAILETETLLLYPKKSYATTDDKVIIRQTGVYIEAHGLDADLTNNRITLRKNVTSIYEPEKS